MIKRLDIKEFSDMTGVDESEFSEAVRKEIALADLKYKILSGQDRDMIILDILKRIDSGQLKSSGSHRKPDWESGWAENLKRFKETGDPSQLAPAYFKPYQVLRLSGDYVMPVTENFIQKFHNIFCRIIFEKYLSGVSCIYEFGCGTGQNVILLAGIFSDKMIYGMDWASSSISIIETLSDRYKNIKGRLFDMFNPDYDMGISNKSAVLTIHSMEQLGSDYSAFLDFLLKKSPSICLHIEPIAELYDNEKLIDYLAARYHNARGYLSGFLSTLKELQRNGIIEIIKIKRAYFGSAYDEGYSIVIWKPLKDGLRR